MYGRGRRTFGQSPYRTHRPVGVNRDSRSGRWAFGRTTSGTTALPVLRRAGDRCGMTRVLVAYSSKQGATKEIADAIGDRLIERGCRADVRPAGTVDSVDGYD